MSKTHKASRRGRRSTARPKDFNAVNFADWAKMPDAFAAGCRFTIWGCSATTHFKFRSRKALQAIEKGLAEDDFFIVRSDVEDHPGGGVIAIDEEHTSELRHRWMMDALYRRNTYAAEAAKKLGIEVRAGCPGTSSDPATIDGVEMLMVDLGTYGDVFRYFRKKFAPEFAETRGKWDQGYVDYHALQSRAAVAKPAFSSQYNDLEIQTTATRWASAGAKITFWNRKSVAHPTPNVTVVLKAVADLVTKGQKGHLFVLRDRDKTKSQAVFVQEDEKVFRITQDAKKEWTVVGPECRSRAAMRRDYACLANSSGSLPTSFCNALPRWLSLSFVGPSSCANDLLGSPLNSLGTKIGS